MNKQELISKIATDTGITKTNAAAAVDFVHRRHHQVAEEGAADHVRRFRHLQDRAAQGAHRAQPADGRRRSRSRSGASSGSAPARRSRRR